MDLTVEFPYSNMAKNVENIPRPYPAELINTPDEPYVAGTGAPLRFFTSATFEKPAFVSTQLGTLERKPWPKSLVDLPRPFNHVDVRRKAKKVAIFFVEQYHIENVCHVRPPASLEDLFQGFDAVGLYMYGIEFCYFVMYYIGKFALEYQSDINLEYQRKINIEYQKKINQKIDSFTKNILEINKKHQIQSPRAENSTGEKTLHRNSFEITEGMNPLEKDLFCERTYHCRKMLADIEKINPLKRRLDQSYSSTWSCADDSQTRSKKYEPEAPRDLKQYQTMKKSSSPSDLFTNPMCRMELENPSTEKYTRGSSFMIFKKCQTCKRIENTREAVIIITDSDIPAVNNEWSGIPRPTFSIPLSSERIFSSTTLKKKDSKSTHIPRARLSDIILGHSKIPRLSCPKPHPAIFVSNTCRKQAVKGTELKERKKTVTAVAGQSKNIRKPNLSANIQKLSPLKPNRLKKNSVPSGNLKPLEKVGRVEQRFQKKPWV